MHSSVQLNARSYVSTTNTSVPRAWHAFLLIVLLSFFCLSSGVQAQDSNSGVFSGRVLDAEDSEPVPGAVVAVLGIRRGAISRSDGSFRIILPPGAYTVRISALGYGMVQEDISVFPGESTEQDFMLESSVVQLGEVTVTVGSRADRTAIETAAPIDIIDARDIARSGYTELGEALQQLAPSFFSANQTVADGTDHVDPASLRGLGPDQVLVLVNGKRRHNSALVNVNGTVGRGSVGTDFNAIPIAAIERIEILRDGAGAQYGSDAIAGVINIQLKTDPHKLETGALAATTAEGDGEEIMAYANLGAELGDMGYATVTAEIRDRQPTNRAGTYTGAVFSDDPATDEALIAERNFDRNSMHIGRSEQSSAALFFNALTPISREVDFYAFGGLSYREGRGFGFYRYPIQEERGNLILYPDGFLPEISTTILDQSLALGMSAYYGDWISNFSLNHGGNTFIFGVDNSINASMGLDSPTEFDAGTLIYDQTSLNVDLLRYYSDEEAGIPLTLAVGGEFRVEHYAIEAGDPESWQFGGDTTSTGAPKSPGAQVFPGFQPGNEVNKRRTNLALYAELESDLNEMLFLGVSSRYENYSDFGDQLSAKFSGRFAPVEHLAFRATIGTGFRAPSLQQRYFNNISTQFVEDPTTGELVARQVLTSENNSPVTRAFGIPSLKEETSLNISAGVVVQPTENFSITLDAYQIDIDDRIVLSGRFADSDPAAAALLAPFTSVSAAQFFTNAVDTRTRGIDLVLAYNIRFGGGELLSSLALNVTQTEVQAIHVPDELVGLEETLFNREEQSRLETVTPGQQAVLGISYRLKDWTATGRVNYYGEVEYVHPSIAANDQTFAAKTTVDAEVQYRLFQGVSFGLGGKNVFDVYPDENIVANQSDGRFLYSRRVTQFGFEGANYYLKLHLDL